MKKVYYIDGDGELIHDLVKDECEVISIYQNIELSGEIFDLRVYSFNGVKEVIYIGASRPSEAYYILKSIKTLFKNKARASQYKERKP